MSVSFEMSDYPACLSQSQFVYLLYLRVAGHGPVPQFQGQLWEVRAPVLSRRGRGSGCLGPQPPPELRGPSGTSFGVACLAVAVTSSYMTLLLTC